MPRQFVVLSACPHTSAHFHDVVSEMFRGTFVECEKYESEHWGYIWDADLFDREMARKRK